MPTATELTPARRRTFPLLAAFVLSSVIVACAIGGRLSVNLNGENFRIAQAMYDGHGYASPTGENTGPTAWCAPVYPTIYWLLLWLGDGDRDVVIVGIAILQVCVLMATGVLILAMVQQTAPDISPWLAMATFLGGLSYHFWHWFRFTADGWLMLLTLDVVIAGFCWFAPLASWRKAFCWGVFGGLCAMVNPSIALAWAGLTLLLGQRTAGWAKLAVTLLAAMLTLAPWTVRNYLVFGRLIPVKSNLAYELYQSQCLQDDGLFEASTGRLHPSTPGSQERHEYAALGEMAYLDRKWLQFRQAVSADPLDFCDRVASRFLGATLWYVPHHRLQESRQPWVLWARRLTHPLPFLALVFLLCTAFNTPLGWPRWVVVGVYVLYLFPYVAASYYERYALPLVGVKTLLVIWAIDRILKMRRMRWSPRIAGLP
jgi:hypothetical protein